jgi:hypothetical protein
MQTGQTWEFGAPPNSVEHPQNIFVFVESSTCTSRPITVSKAIACYLPLLLLSKITD